MIKLKLLAVAIQALSPQRALIVRRKWLDLIVAGVKTFEIRSHAHHFAGQRIFLVEARSGHVRCKARLLESHPMSPREGYEHQEVLDELRKSLKYVRPNIWPMDDIIEVLAELWLTPSQRRRYYVTWIPQCQWANLVRP